MIQNALDVSMFTGGVFEVVVLTVACIGLFWDWINWQDILKIDLS